MKCQFVKCKLPAKSIFNLKSYCKEHYKEMKGEAEHHPVKHCLICLAVVRWDNYSGYCSKCYQTHYKKIYYQAHKDHWKAYRLNRTKGVSL